MVSAQHFPKTTKEESVIIRFSIWDQKSQQFVKGLDLDHLEIREEDKKVPINYLSSKEETATIGFLIDLSGSASLDRRNSKFSEIATNVNGFGFFLRSINPGNTYFVNEFSDKSETIVDLTTDITKVKKGLDGLAARKPKGNTSVYDAVSSGITKLASFAGKKILVVASDGIDNSSQISTKQLKKQLQESGVTVYLINFVASSDELLFLPAGAALADMIKDCGGEVFFPSKGREVNDAFELLGNHMRSQYVVGISPAEKKTERWHKVKVILKLGKDERSVAQTGYYH